MEYLVIIMFIVTTAALLVAARKKTKAMQFDELESYTEAIQMKVADLENTSRKQRVLIELLSEENKRLRKELEDKYEQIEIINKSKS